MIELMGPAGSGKSAVAQILYREDGLRPNVRLRYDAPHLPFVVLQTAQLSPMLLRLRLAGRGCDAEELKKLIYLRAWHRVLQRQAASEHSSLVIDQGPVFNLGTLRAFGPPGLRAPGLADWWEQTLRRWAGVLDVLVWLDADDEALIERIRAREKAHPVKELGSGEARTLLARYRDAFEWVVAQLGAMAPLRILRLDSSRERPADLAARVLDDLRIDATAP